MNISYNWLKDYLSIDLDIQKVSEILTDIGLEVGGYEEIQTIKGGLKGLVVGEVLTCVKHPNADKLSVTTVNIGNSDILPIVCGAPNVAAGQKVVVATVGAELYSGNESFTIKKSKIRGELSQGMICAEDEIGLGASHDGIMVLDPSAIPGTAAKDYFHVESDFQIEIDITPNRIDGASHIGVARDLAAFLQQTDESVQVRWPSVEAFKVDNTSLPIDVSVENQEACPRYSGLTISGVTVQDSPDWLKKKLVSIGLAPINNIVDITNFVLHETTQPLHAFDAAHIKGNKVLVKTLPQNTLFTTLDEEERKLDERDLMICNEEEGMCIAGVFGGLSSGVSSGTQNIFLESAYFNPVWVRKTAKRHTLSTDSSFRFERGTDPNKTVYALKRAALLIKEIAGGSISSEIVDVYPERIMPKEVSVSYTNIQRLIGKDLPHSTIKKIVKSLEMDILSENEDQLVLSIPTYRVDITREVDVVEDVLRIYGYNNVDISNSVKSTIIHSVKPDDHTLKNLVANVFNGMSYTEIMSNSLTKSAYYSKLETFPENKSVKVINPLSNDLESMRQTLLFGGLESVAFNKNHKQPNLRLYEFGNCYQLSDNQSDKHSVKAYNQHQTLGIFVTGNTNEQSWFAKEEKVSVYELKSVVDNILLRIGIDKNKVKLAELSNDIWSGGLTYTTHSGQILVNFGAISSKLLSTFKMDDEVFYAEINWDVALKLTLQSKVQFTEINKFPEVKRDLSLLVDKHITYAELEKIGYKTDNKILQRINLFDVYEGKNIPTGKKSYAMSFYLQDKDKNLVDKVIDKVMNKLMNSYKHQLSAEVRGN